MFTINYRDARPIYEQVKDSLRRSIITGVLATDDKIPSVRELAGQLAINPNTIQKAYRELETEGYIYSVPGKGSFVSECEQARNAHKTELFVKLDAAVAELTQLDVSIADICAHIKENSSREAQK